MGIKQLPPAGQTSTYSSGTRTATLVGANAMGSFTAGVPASFTGAADAKKAPWVIAGVGAMLGAAML